jgi:hypothetical protein
MNDKQKKYIVEQMIWSFFINGIINGLLAYFLNKNKPLETLSMQENYFNLIIDIAITAVIFGWLIAWTVNYGVRKAGLYASLTPQNKIQTCMGKWFRIPARYGWMWCLIVIPAIYGLTVVGILTFGVTQFTLWGWTLYKTGYTAVMGAAFSAIFITSAYYADAANLEPKKKKVKA